MNRYLPLTEEDKQRMLQEIGVQSTDELFADIPEAIRYPGNLPLRPALDESKLVRYFQSLAGQNAHAGTHSSFLGAGTYDHYIPSVVPHVISRSEFYTSYTPYQPEISQGNLQAIFEFQSMICALTEMDVANSSMYDGPTAVAEAAAMAHGHKNKRKIVVSEGVHPEARSILHTTAISMDLEMEVVPTVHGRTQVEHVKSAIDSDTAAVIIQSPNFFGCLEDGPAIEKVVHAHPSLFIVSANPLSFGVIQPPGAYGADVVVGDAQVFGIPPSFGGPHCGYFAVRKPFMRKIPGRLVGETKDEDGKRGYVLTLQTREQHIRREKATSNICSNQALNAVAASVAMTALGKKGLQEMAQLNISKALYARNVLSQIRGVQDIFADSPIFNEFVLTLPRPVAEVNERLFERGIIGGYDLSRNDKKWNNHMLVAVTEQRSKAEIDHFASVLEEIVHG